MCLQDRGGATCLHRNKRRGIVGKFRGRAKSYAASARPHRQLATFQPDARNISAQFLIQHREMLLRLYNHFKKRLQWTDFRLHKSCNATPFFNFHFSLFQRFFSPFRKSKILHQQAGEPMDWSERDFNKGRIQNRCATQPALALARINF